MGFWRRMFTWDVNRLPVVTKPCPRCGATVDVPSMGVMGISPYARIGGTFPPTVAQVVRACGCEALGVPPVKEWRERSRRRFASW